MTLKELGLTSLPLCNLFNSADNDSDDFKSWRMIGLYSLILAPELCNSLAVFPCGTVPNVDVISSGIL